MTSDRGRVPLWGRLAARVRWGWIGGASWAAGGVLALVTVRPWWSVITMWLGRWWAAVGAMALLGLGVVAMHRRAMTAESDAHQSPPPAVGSGNKAVGAASEAAARRSSLSGWVVLAAAVGVLGVAGLVLAMMWDWAAVSGLGVKDAASTRLETVKIAASAAVAGGGLFALYLAARRQRTQELELAQRRDEFAHNEYDATQRRVTELYTKAVEQLGSDKAVVRQGGLYALERVAQDNLAHRQTVINVICAYLRAPYTPPPDRPGARRTRLSRSLRGTPSARVAAATAAARRTSLYPPTPTPTHDESRQEREVRLTAQRILAVHLRSDVDKDTGRPSLRYWLAGYDLDLTGATLIDFDMTGCHVNTASFRGATFNGNAWFTDATFNGNASFHGATINGNAQFRGATINGNAQFHGATINGNAWFDDATINGNASFNDATLNGNAWFAGATIDGYAQFDDATIRGDAWFARATINGNASFNETTINGNASFSAAAFESVATAGNMWVRVDQPRSSANRTPESSWPAGWTVDASAGESRDDTEGSWARLVPVPIVLVSVPLEEATA